MGAFVVCCRVTSILVILAWISGLYAEEQGGRKPQYQSDPILIPGASKDEPIRAEFSAELADRYLTDGALAWSRERKCVSCHTNGSYLAVRGALTAMLGPPPTEMREFFVEQAKKRVSAIVS